MSEHHHADPPRDPEEETHTPSPELSTLTFDASGWKERERSSDWSVWENEEGDVVSLAVGSDDLPSLSDGDAWLSYGRELAEARQAGLLSVNLFADDAVPSAQVIYKRQHGNGYVYTAMLLVPRSAVSHVLCLICGERGTTGVREAVVTVQLLEAGELDVQSYEERWFRDPYDAGYEGLVLRSMSDDEVYDAKFPDHPLSRMRRTLPHLRSSLRLNV